MGLFSECMGVTAKWEGGWSDHKADPGGKTNWGITQAALSQYLGRPATASEIRALTKAEAQVIYRKLYWDRVSGDSLPAGIDLCVFDFGVNSGPSRAVKSLQAALGVKADGWVGEKTLAAIAERDPKKLIVELCDRRMAFLQKLPTWKTFGKGWANRVADVERRAHGMAAGFIVPPQPDAVPVESGSAKAEPPLPVEKKVSTEQKVGLGAGLLTALGGLASFWKEHGETFHDPVFIGVVAVLAAVVGFLLLRKPALIEQVS
jgi:lysozyme family protein